MNPPEPKYFRPGQLLFREGETSHSFFLVQKGTVSVRKMKGAAQIEIARIYANEVLGELSFFDRLPRSASAVALTEVEVLEIQFDALDKVYAAVPDYMKTIVSSIAERLRRANDTIRRLQKDVVSESGEAGAPADTPSASEILAATADVPATSKKTKPDIDSNADEESNESDK
ncbi:MAG: hypothetical protein A2X94_13965 [Bdellovibrionales bacterium GWB1_55_8]|nr:MAG: hypothetical protein A2X94_13965 [Bdellovibrionales bacterium GWB1_55_8]